MPRRIWDVEEIPIVQPWVSGMVVIGISTIIALAIVFIVKGI